MKKTIKKSLIILFALAVVMMTMGMPAALADATVSITFDDAAMEASTADGGRMVSNLYPTQTNETSVSTVEGYYVDGGIIKFNFSEPMDVNTLTPANIKITLGGTTYLANNPKYDSGTGGWTYTPYEVTPTSYSLNIAEMCEGKMKHTVTFTSGVQTAGGESIVPVTKVFTTGRITTTAGVGGKKLMDVAYNKTVSRLMDDGTVGTIDTTVNQRLVDYAADYSQGGSTTFVKENGTYVRIDLGNYYNIYDVILYNTYDTTDYTGHCNINVYYSNDPGATALSATLIKELNHNTTYPSGNIVGSNSGRGLARYLSPAAPFRARYVFLRVTSPKSAKAYGENTAAIRVIAEVDADFGAMTATKGGAAVTAYSGTGDYTVSVPVRENTLGAADGYMIVAGFDANGLVTRINCAPVTLSGGTLSLTTTIDNASTTSLKAVLIKSLQEPQMLTDALVLQ